MKTTIDKRAGASYITLKENPRKPLRTKTLAEGVYGDYDANDELVGIEILSVLEIKDITNGW